MSSLIGIGIPKMSSSIGIGKPKVSNSIGIGKPKWILIGQTNSKHLIATFPSICLTQSKHCRRFKKHGAPRVTL